MTVNTSFLPTSGQTNVQQPSASSNQSTMSDFWKARMTQNQFCGLTATEITRLSMRLLGLGAAGLGIYAAATAILGSASWSLGLLAIPCALVSAGALWYSFQLDDYENPEELEKFREDATRMDLEQVMQVHGWGNVLHWGIITAEQFADKYRRQMRGKSLSEIIDAYEKTVRHISQCSNPKYDYEVPVPSEWKGIWRTETATKTFEEIIQGYPLEKFEKYNLLEVGELRRIKTLKHIFETIKGSYDTQVNQIEREFQSHTETYKRNYESECALADQLYNDNWAVHRLRVFEIEYVRERQAVQETVTRRKNEARNRFNQAVATITNHGQIPYDRLSVQDKVFYDQQNNEWQVSVVHADSEARIQIENIDARCIREKNQLISEELRVREERTRKLNEAKGRYDSDVLSHRRYKENRIEPLNLSFRSTVNDLNGRYLAYLRTVGAV